MTRIRFLFIRHSARTNYALFPGTTYVPRRTNFRRFLLIVPIAALIYMVWPTSGEDQQAMEPMTLDEHIQWSNFYDVVDKTLQAQTLEDALSALTGLRYVVNHLPYKDERHEHDANFWLDTAENHLVACQTNGRTHPNYWRDKLSNALASIPRYARRLDKTPPPPIIDPQ